MYVLVKFWSRMPALPSLLLYTDIVVASSSHLFGEASVTQLVGVILPCATQAVSANTTVFGCVPGLRSTVGDGRPMHACSPDHPTLTPRPPPRVYWAGTHAVCCFCGCGDVAGSNSSNNSCSIDKLKPFPNQGGYTRITDIHPLVPIVYRLSAGRRIATTNTTILLLVLILLVIIRCQM